MSVHNIKETNKETRMSIDKGALKDLDSLLPTGFYGFVFNPKLTNAFKEGKSGILVALFLSYLMFCQKNGQVSKTQVELNEETSFPKTRQKSAIKELVKQKLVTVETVDSSIVFTLDMDKIKDLTK